MCSGANEQCESGRADASTTTPMQHAWWARSASVGVTAAALVAAVCAFAANSILCRLALAEAHIAPEWFTALRMASGAMVLAAVLLWRTGGLKLVWDPIAALALLVYAECFAWAYVELDAGAGALLLFGAVQLTMTTSGLLHGERLTLWAWFGLIAAGAGLVVFMLPAEIPNPSMAALGMLAAGCAWGVYSLRGRRRDALTATAWNFILVAPVACVIAVAGDADIKATPSGIGLALLSGAITSGLGYVVWYRAVAALSMIGAATAQLTVPIVAAVGGILFIGETPTLKLAAVAIAVLGGTMLVNFGLHRASAVSTLHSAR